MGKIKHTLFVMVYFSILILTVAVLYSLQSDFSKEDTVFYERLVNNKYYVDKKGIHLVGMQKINGKKYYFDKRGVLKTGWINISEKERYYANEEGEIVTGEQVISDVKYTFGRDGKLIDTDLQDIKMVALTFDDGPSVYTDRILDILEKYDSKATFFLIGQRASDYSEQLKREAELGCQIGSHTYTHKYLTTLSYGQLQEEIDKTNEAVKEIVGQETSCIRPPGGFYDNRVAEIINCPVAMWSVDTLDWKSKDAVSVANIATSDIKDGDIILMHDLYESTAEAVEKIVPELINQGFKLVTFSELINANGGAFDGRIYYSTTKIKSSGK